MLNLGQRPYHNKKSHEVIHFVCYKKDRLKIPKICPQKYNVENAVYISQLRVKKHAIFFVILSENADRKDS